MLYKDCNRLNYGEVRAIADIKYIVVHFTENNGDTVKNNLDYFAREYVGASAHYFVDENDVGLSAPIIRTAWHCGTRGTYYHSKCRNANSIGVEMCSKKRNGVFYIPEKTQELTAALVARLMKEYKIPIENVVRHYDVTHKLCPEPFVREPAQWGQFKRKVIFYYNGQMQEKEEKEVRYNYISEIPAGEMRETVDFLFKKGVIKGDGQGKLDLSLDMIRMFVFNKRAHLYDNL